MENYSRGGDSPDNLRTNIPLSVYIANSEGKTDTKYFRYNYPNSILLDNVTVSYNKKELADNQHYSVDYSKHDACKFIS